MDVALGTVDALEWSSSTRGTMRVWHHVLNNDFPVAATGGEDSNTSLHRHTMYGSVRTYAYLGPTLDRARWIDAVGAGTKLRKHRAADRVSSQPAHPWRERFICRRRRNDRGGSEGLVHPALDQSARSIETAPSGRTSR